MYLLPGLISPTTIVTTTYNNNHSNHNSNSRRIRTNNIHFLNSLSNNRTRLRTSRNNRPLRRRPTEPHRYQTHLDLTIHRTPEECRLALHIKLRSHPTLITGYHRTARNRIIQHRLAHTHTRDYRALTSHRLQNRRHTTRRPQHPIIRAQCHRAKPQRRQRSRRR